MMFYVYMQMDVLRMMVVLKLRYIEDCPLPARIDLRWALTGLIGSSLIACPQRFQTMATEFLGLVAFGAFYWKVSDIDACHRSRNTTTIARLIRTLFFPSQKGNVHVEIPSFVDVFFRKRKGVLSVYWSV